MAYVDKYTDIDRYNDPDAIEKIRFTTIERNIRAVKKEILEAREKKERYDNMSEEEKERHEAMTYFN